MIIRYIGDIHSKIDEWHGIASGAPEGHSVQIGDFGVGFGSGPASYNVGSRIQGHRFIRGNHDNPDQCRQNPNWIPDGTVEDDVMYVGGAYSLDKEYRTEWIDWWPDEELSYNDLQLLIDKYLIVKPKIMITHDCPEAIIPHCFPKALKIKSRTQQAFSAMWESEWKPLLWIFGHWHERLDKELLGTRFICLPELGFVDIDIEKAAPCLVL